MSHGYYLNMTDKMFTVNIDVYYGLNFFQQALENIRNQTYSNLEIIISNNGALPEIQDFIKDQLVLIHEFK